MEPITHILITQTELMIDGKPDGFTSLAAAKAFLYKLLKGQYTDAEIAEYNEGATIREAINSEVVHYSDTEWIIWEIEPQYVPVEEAVLWQLGK